MLNARNLVMPMSGCAVTRLDDICRRAIGNTATQPGRAVVYVPDRRIDAVGCWRAGLLGSAVTLLLEEVLATTGRDERVELRWRVDEDAAVIRVKHPRATASGGRLVTFFDADAAAYEDRGRLVGAREALLGQGGTLARVRTLRGTTYVATVPRCEASRAAALDVGASASQQHGAEVLALYGAPGPAVSIYVSGGPRRLRRIHGLMERASELLAEWCSPEECDALLQPIAAIARSEAPPQGPVAFLRNRGTLLVLRLSREVPEMVAVGAHLDTAPIARVPFTVWRHVRDGRHGSSAVRRRSSEQESDNSFDHAR